jgi:hypothetical protein
MKIVVIGGPELFHPDELVRRDLAARLGETRFGNWRSQPAKQGSITASQRAA